MSIALIAALFFAGALLLTSAYFLMGAVPLLTLKHDTPMDARFVRNFFNVYYVAASFTAGAAALSFAWAGTSAYAAGAALLAALAALAATLRARLLPKMDALGAEIQAGQDAAIASFRRLHVAAILVNFGQVVLLVWRLIAASMPH